MNSGEKLASKAKRLALSLGVIATVTGTILSFAVADANSSRDQATSIAIDCPIDIRDLGPVTCGKLSVPEHWVRPESDRRIALTYLILHATGDSIAADPAIWLEGGPGGSPIYRTHIYAELLSDIRADRDVVFLAQRGTGFAEPLDCIAPSALKLLENGGRFQDLVVAFSTVFSLSEAANYTAVASPEEYISLYH